MRVTIPSCEQHEGFFSMTVTISDYCPKCGGKRGVPYKGFSYDGSRRLVVDCWENPCGHVDKYSEVREEVRRGKNQKIEKYVEQLTKAKEIIKKFSEFVNNEAENDPEYSQEQTDLWNELCDQAEQFLKKADK